MMITQTADAIITRLAVLRGSGLWVKKLPNKAGKQGVIQDNGVLSLAWEKDTPAPPDRLDRNVQECTRNWVIEGRVQNIREEAGLETLIDVLHQLIVGFKPAGSGELYAVSCEMSDRTASYWVFEYRFAGKVVLVGQAEPTEPVTLLKEVFFTPVVVTDQWEENPVTIESL